VRALANARGAGLAVLAVRPLAALAGAKRASRACLAEGIRIPESGNQESSYEKEKL